MAEEIVTPGEEVLWTGSVSQWHYAGRWLVILLLAAGLVASFAWPLPAALPPLIVRGVIAGAILVILLWIWLDKGRRKYSVTTKRVSVEYGILSKNSTEMRIQDIRSINLTTSGISGMIGIGRLEFSSAAADEDDVIFWNTPGAPAVRDLVRNLQAGTEPQRAAS
jgi:uncharacterized membrane protein YdbT with pleckstrin-like domain